MAVLIFGGSGFVGRELREYFEQRGEAVIGTYYRNGQRGLRKFDLEHAVLDSIGTDLKGVTYAVVCCSMTDMDRCKREWDRVHRVYVEGTIALLAQLQAAGIVPVFMSSDYVYDGAKGNYSESDLRNPVLAYGLQKKLVEDFLLQSASPFIVVRAGRIYSLREGDGQLLMSIVGALRKGETLRMAADQVFSPTYVKDVCRAISSLVQARRFGCYNLGSPTALSRFELGNLVKERLGITTGEVVRCRLADLEFGDRRPLDTSLNPRLCQQVVGFRFSSVEESLQRVCESMGVQSHLAYGGGSRSTTDE